MGMLLQRLEIRGFRSFQETGIDLRALNVLVGANGSGKSNLILALRMLRAFAAGAPSEFVAVNGGANALLCGGRDVTRRIALGLDLAAGFQGTLEAEPDADGGLAFRTTPAEWPQPLVRQLADIHIFHFKDLLPRRRALMEAPEEEDSRLRTGGVNLGPCLFWLREQRPDAYRRIVETTRLIAPFFGEFEFERRGLNLRLRWREEGMSMLHGPEALSDGTIRFISLITLLLQPEDRLPPMILLDEPELGLHPWATQILAELIAGAAAHTQVLLSTQSVTLLNAFTLADAIVVDRDGAGSVLRRPDPEALRGFADDAPLGELWERNLLGGTP